MYRIVHLTDAPAITPFGASEVDGIASLNLTDIDAVVLIDSVDVSLTFNIQLLTFNSQPSLETVAQVIGLTKDRVNFVSELWEQVNFFFVAPEEYDEKSLKKRWKEDSPKHMTEMLTLLEAHEDWSAEGLDNLIMPWIAEKEYGVGIVMNAFRICLVGAARGPHIWNITDVLGKDETLRRVRSALEKLG